MKKLTILSMVLAMIGLRCGGEDPHGGVGEPCYPNDTCLAGLTCEDGTCVPNPGGCGNTVCDPTEDVESCPQDCEAVPHCGDGVCNFGETVDTCPGDCKPLCGDGVVEGAEVCDGDDVMGQRCTDLGYTGGVLGCASNCLTLDARGCTDTCGNDAVEGGEVCDGADTAGQSCVTLGHAGGDLACADDCSAFVTSGCVDQLCGNGIIEAPEVCDGSELSGETCLRNPAFNGGTLNCNAGCTDYDESECWNATCGNDIVEGNEACDGTALDEQTCDSLGFFGGSVTCDASCLEFNTSACGGSSCDMTNNCNSCTSCAFNLPCHSEYTACTNNASCVALGNCLNGCFMNPSCPMGCMSAHPAGAALFQAMMTCAYCDACQVDCAGASQQITMLGISCQ